MSVVPALRRNDPAVTRIEINLRNETSDAGDLAQALEENPFITAITVNLAGVQTTNFDWRALLRVIETRANLEDVTLMNSQSVEAASAILQAIQQNTAIQGARLICLRLPTDLSTFVDAATSLSVLSMAFCDIESAADLAAALQRNTNILDLHLVGFLDDVCMCSILQSLRANSTLKTIALGGNVSDATARAIQQLLESTTSVQTFELAFAFFTADEVRPVAQAIIGSKCVSKLRFRRCQFSDEETTTIFRSILQNKRNLSSLHLVQCHFRGGQVHETIMSALLQPRSPLRSFELQDSRLSTLPNGQFQNLLRAVEKSKLNHFTIGYITSQQQLHVLADSIPLMRLKELKVVVESDLGEENAKQLLLQAVKNNFSLRSVKCNRSLNGSSDIFNADDRTRLVFYADRNERLDQWVDNPETVDDRKVWPEALKLAEKAGPDSLFRGLRLVLESDHVSSRNGRKRKRPQYFVPP